MILVTGYKGFIGQNLVKRFDSTNIYYSEIDTCFDDIYNDIDWNQIDLIYHMGAVSDTTETDIDKIYRYNIDFTLKLFDIAIKRKIPVKYASSASVYGNTDRNINPLNYYAMSKATVDYFVKDNLKKFSSIQGYRFFNVYGKHEDHKKNQASPIYQFSKQAQDTGKIKVFDGSRYFYRDFVWVEDVIDCMLEDRESGIYDVGTSSPVSFARVAEMIAKKYNVEIETVPFPEHLKGKYQLNTCSKKDFYIKFTHVSEYIQNV